jgi:hypothetical protein
VKYTKVSVMVRMKSLKNCGITSVVMLAIAPFLICKKVAKAISKQIKFLPSLKHLSLFFLIFSRERGNKSVGKVERGDVVKKFDSRFTI